MKRTTLNLVLALVVAVLALTSCSKGDTVAPRLIPDDAIAVVRFDVKQFIAKSGVDEDSPLLKKLKQEMRSSDISSELRERIIAILLNPSNSGIDFDRPIYLYGSPNRRHSYGVVGSMGSKSDFTELLNTIAEETGSDVDIDEEDGVCRVEGVLAYTDQWFFIGDRVDDDMVEQLQEMVQTGEGSLADDEAFRQLSQQEGVASLLVLGRGIAQVDDRDVREVLRQLPDGLDLADVAMVADLQLNEGEAVVTSQVVALSDDWQQYIDESDRTALAIDDDLARYVTAEGLAVFVNIKTQDVWKQVKKLIENETSDAELKDMARKVFQSLDGSLALSITGATNHGPNLGVFAKTSDEYIVEMLAQVTESDNLQSMGNNAFRACEYGYDWDAYFNGSGELERIITAYYDFGRKNDITYLYYGNQPSDFAAASPHFNASDVQGRGFYARLSADIVNHLDSDMFGGEEALAMVRMVTDQLRYLEAYYEGEGRSVMRLAIADEDKTPLALVIDLIAQFI